MEENLNLLTTKFNVIHIHGKQNTQISSHKNYLPLPYAENIEDYYARADVVISRAGSGVINELLVLNKPMLLIPLSKKCSRGDQIENAKLFQSLNLAKMLEEEDVSKDLVFENLDYLLKNSEIIKKNMKNYSKNDAKTLIFEIIKENELK